MQNPFPGPQPYRASDRDRFYGRDDLAYRLEASILANRCVTVFGPSGAGKSSLVQAAVLPSLIEKQEIRVARVDAWPEDQDPTRWLADAVYGALGLGDRPAGASPAEALVTAAQRAARGSPRLVVVYLDQIEQLLYAARPAAEAEVFFDSVSRLAELPTRNLRLVLSLREDYLGRFRDRLREHHRILDHGFRVGPLTVAELCEAVCQAAAAGEPPQTWTPAEMRPLMLQVRVPGQAEGDEAEGQAAYAQIVCRALFQQRGQGEAADAAEAEPILRRYLEATLADLGALRDGAQRLLEDHLVTADGSRTLRTEKELLRVLPADELGPALKALEGAAILHAAEHQGSRYFEIGHDWLARKVFEERQRRQQEEAHRRERALAQARLAEERARRRRFAAVAVASLLIAAFAVSLGSVAYSQKLRADRLRVAEVRARREADRLRDLAERKRSEAHDASILAGFRELAVRARLPAAMKLLPEVELPAMRRGWIELASDALAANALRATLRGHVGALSAVAWSPDGKRVLTASADGTAQVWSADGTGRAVVLKGHGGAILAAAWSAGGAHVLTGSEDGTARVWNPDGAGPPVVLEGHGGGVTAVAASPDGARVLTASSDGTARVWSADGTGKPIVLAGHVGPIDAAVWSPDGQRVITAGSDRTARVWELGGKRRRFVLRGHTGEVVSVAASPDGTRVVTGSRDRTARVFRPTGDSAPVVLAGHEDSVSHVAVSPDGLRVATASADRTVRVWSADGEAEPVVLTGHTLAVSFVSWSPDGKYIASASADRTARLWPADGSGPPLVLVGHGAPLRAAAWSPDGTRVATAASDPRGRSLDRTAKVWSTEPLRSMPHRRRNLGFFHAASVAEGGARVVAAFEDRTARVFRVDGEGEPVVLRGHEGWVASASLSGDGTRVVTASFDRTARVWSADGKGEPVVLRGHEAELRAAALSPDGARVVTASDDGTARVWSADGKGDPLVLRGHEDWLTSAAWSPDGTRVLTTSLDRTARVWSADGKGDPLVLEGHDGEVYTGAWSFDGKRVVTASDDGTARVWKADGEGDSVVLRGHEGAVTSALFSPDGARVATSSADGTVRLWGADRSSAPIVLGARTPIIAMIFLDGGQRLLAVAMDNGIHTWMTDVDALRQRLLAAHTDCLTPDVRVTYLGETASVARDQYTACERSYQRSPLPVEVPRQ
ncbi:nSTAND1 domain-containing NTPase [Sorangium sp. So ce233]|uniref:nSTAND1 domain-containing NTPase n=1 Tax=Sorangium sp. So ce233 TaxID=3133290 RepID=UPI003F625E43